MTSLAENPPPEDSSQIETTLRLVCSMSGNHHRACWEDVTDDTPLVFGNGCVTFTSILSASFWLVECPNWMISDVMCLVDQLYKVRIANGGILILQQVAASTRDSRVSLCDIEDFSFAV